MIDFCIINEIKFLKIGELFANNCSVRKLQKVRNIAAKVTITLLNVAKRCKMNWVAETSKKFQLKWRFMLTFPGRTTDEETRVAIKMQSVIKPPNIKLIRFRLGLERVWRCGLRVHWNFFLSFSWFGSVSHLPDATKTSLSPLCNCLIYPWIQCLFQEEETFQKTSIAKQLVIDGFYILSLHYLFTVKCFEDQCGEFLLYIIYIIDI